MPQTSHLILLAALVAVGLFVLTATGRNLVRGRNVGLLVGAAGLLATLQLGYRMLAPPFDFELRSTETLSLTGSCLWYCPPAEAANADLLVGIWLAFVGCIAVTAGGFLHAFSPTARQTEARPWIAPEQGGLIAVLGFVTATRILYRIVQPPFGEGPVEIGAAAYLSAIAGILVLVAGIVYAATSRQSARGSAARRTVN